MNKKNEKAYNKINITFNKNFNEKNKYEKKLYFNKLN